MKYKALLAISALTVSASALGGPKVAEWGDPAIGNDYNDCEFQQVYGTGGGGYLYSEYEITCPDYGTFTVGVLESWNPHGGYYKPRTCTFYPEGGYTANGTCDNWRVYLDN